MVRVRRAVGASVLAVVLFCSCVLPPAEVDEGGGGVGGGVAGCGYQTGVPACQACGATSCCSEMQACAPGTACGNLLSCIGTYCTDGNVPENCGSLYCSQHSAGLDAAAAVFDCLCLFCPSECGPCTT